MKLSKKINLALLSFLFIAPSCKKYLNEKPNKSLVILTSLDDLQAMLDDTYTLNANTPALGETSADDYFIKLPVYNALYSRAQEAYTWSLEDYNYQNNWSYAYSAIYPINYCLDNIGKVKKTRKNKTQWNNIKGSALFYRSFWFLDLVWDYAKAYDNNTSQKDLGIVLRQTSDFNKPSMRSTVKECYDKILKDTKEAVPLLPDNPLKVTRPSKCAAYALLARTYLSMRIYDSAYKYADLALQTKHSLLNYNSVQVNPASLIPFQPLNDEIIFFTTQSNYYPSKSPNNALVDTVLFSTYDSNDLRKTVFFHPKSGYYEFKGNYNASNRYLYFSGIATDEMFLTRAECSARLGNVTNALKDLNTLLVNRWKTGTFKPIITTNQQQVLQIILTERRKELLMRGLRWIDIKRLNKEGNNVMLKRIVGDNTYTLKPNDNRYALPLPTDIINITGMKQNPR